MVSQQIANLSCLTAVKVRFLVSPLCDCIPPVEEVAELDSMRKWVSL